MFPIAIIFLRILLQRMVATVTSSAAARSLSSRAKRPNYLKVHYPRYSYPDSSGGCAARIPERSDVFPDSETFHPFLFQLLSFAMLPIKDLQMPGQKCLLKIPMRHLWEHFRSKAMHALHISADDTSESSLLMLPHSVLSYGDIVIWSSGRKIYPRALLSCLGFFCRLRIFLGQNGHPCASRLLSLGRVYFFIAMAVARIS